MLQKEQRAGTTVSVQCDTISRGLEGSTEQDVDADLLSRDIWQGTSPTVREGSIVPDTSPTVREGPLRKGGPR